MIFSATTINRGCSLGPPVTVVVTGGDDDRRLADVDIDADLTARGGRQRRACGHEYGYAADGEDECSDYNALDRVRSVMVRNHVLGAEQGRKYIWKNRLWIGSLTAATKPL